MAVTFSISPNPHWVIIDNFSKLPNGAAIYTFSSLNPSQFKPAFQDAGGMIPFGQPIVGFGNGTMPPIYWKFDDADPTDLYYIEVWDKVKVPGNDAVMLWNFTGLPSFTTSGGGGIITTNLDLENLVSNGEFYWNVANLPVAPATSVPTQITLAPSNHAGFSGVAHSVNDGAPAPDIIFAKGDQSATDSISFIDFPNGDTTFSPAPTPQIYVNYTTAVAGSEAYKFIQFPIVKGLRNLENINISIAMWNRYNGGDSGITLSLRQFFGNGTNGPSADVPTSIGSLQFSGTNWNKTIFNSVLVPSTAGKTFGNCGNDGLFLQIRIPSSVLINFDFILPAVYIGNTTSTVDFHTLDFVDAIVMTPRTGDTRITLNSFHDYGWVPANDGTIGSSTSLATTRANIDTFPLYDLIWNAIPDSLAPVTGGRGVSSEADFGNNKAMALTRNLGRVMAGALPVIANQSFTRAGNTITMATTAGFYTGMAVNVSGGGLPAPLLAGTIYYAIIVNATTMQLATTTANAFSGTFIVLTSAGTGTIVSQTIETIGSFVGEETHVQSIAEMPAHTHGPGGVGATSFQVKGGVGTGFGGAGGAVDSTLTASTGGGLPFNQIQPTVYMNVYFKL